MELGAVSLFSEELTYPKRVYSFSDEQSIEETPSPVVALRRPHEHGRGGPRETAAGLDAGNATGVSPTVLRAVSQRKDDEWTDAARRSAT